MYKIKKILEGCWANFKDWFTLPAFIGLILGFLGMVAVFVLLVGSSLASAIFHTLPIFIFVFLGILTKEKTDRIFAALFMGLIGVALINSVLEDFIKTMKITVGLFMLSGCFEALMHEFGDPHKKILKKASNRLRKKPGCDDDGTI